MTAVADLTQNANDWILACQVQQRFMQQSQPVITGVKYSVCCSQLDGVGGDFYEVNPLSEERVTILFVLADKWSDGTADSSKTH